MNQVYRIATRYHRFFVLTFLASTCFLVMGCAGSVVGDAENVLSVISLAVSTLSGVFAFIPGAAAFAVPLNAVGTTLSTLEQLFAEYKTTATETTYQKIQQFVALLEQNLQALLTPEGVSSALVAKVNGIVSAILTQVGTWLALITQLQAPSTTPTTASVEPEVAAAPVTVSVVKPMSAKALQSQLKAIVEEDSGDESINWAFKTASRL
jgi:hypothetical protein